MSNILKSKGLNKSTDQKELEEFGECTKLNQ